MTQTAMKFASKFFKSVLGKQWNERKEERFAVHQGVKGQIAQDPSAAQKALFSTIDVLDISKSGMAFVIKNGNIEVGDTVEIILDSDTNGRATQKGKVLSNRLIGQSFAVDGRQALRRFSVQFQEELDASVLENIRTMRLSKMA